MHFILFLVNSLESPSSTRLLSSILNFHFFVQNETVEQQNFINNRTRSYLEEYEIGSKKTSPTRNRTGVLSGPSRCEGYVITAKLLDCPTR